MDQHAPFWTRDVATLAASGCRPLISTPAPHAHGNRKVLFGYQTGVRNGVPERTAEVVPVPATSI